MMPKPKLSTLTQWMSAGLFLLTSMAAPGQTTNPAPALPPTRIEALETNLGVVVIKCTAMVGSVPVGDGEVVVTCKEDFLTSTGQRELGLLVGFGINNRLEDRVTLDFDELESLLSAFDYLNKLDWSSMPLASFDAFYKSKGGLRVSAYSSRRQGTVEFRIRTSDASRGAAMTRDQMARLRGLIDEGKRKLDSLRAS